MGWMIGGLSPNRGCEFFSLLPHPDLVWGPPSLLSKDLAWGPPSLLSNG